MNERDQQPDEGDLRATGKLAGALRQAHNQHVFVPPQVDNAILAQARQHLGIIAGTPHPASGHPLPSSDEGRGQGEGCQPVQHIVPGTHSGKWQPVAWWGALAASLALMAGWWFRQDKTPLPATGKAASLAGDINGDQQVDVLDALVLAQRIEQGTAAGLSDLNGDAVIDQRDAEWIAQQAVRLEKGGVL